MHLGMLGDHNMSDSSQDEGPGQTSALRLGSYEVAGVFAPIDLDRLSTHQIRFVGQEPGDGRASLSAEFVVEYAQGLSESDYSVIRREAVDVKQSGIGSVKFTPTDPGYYKLRFVVGVVHSDGTSMDGEVSSQYQVKPPEHRHSGGSMWGVGEYWLVIPIVMMGGMLVYALFGR